MKFTLLAVLLSVMLMAYASIGEAAGYYACGICCRDLGYDDGNPVTSGGIKCKVGGKKYKCECR